MKLCLIKWNDEPVASVCSTKWTAFYEAAPGAAQGRLRPWDPRACDKCSKKHDGLAWSAPSTRLGWKSEQKTGGHASERNPSEPPSLLRVGENTPFGVHYEAKKQNVAKKNIPVATH